MPTEEAVIQAPAIAPDPNAAAAVSAVTVPPNPPAPVVEGAQANAVQAPITFPTAQAFEQRLDRARRQGINTLLSKYGVKTEEELDQLLATKETVAEPNLGNGNGGDGNGVAKPASRKGTELEMQRKIDDLNRQVETQKERVAAVKYESEIHEHAIRSGITEPAYIEAAKALLAREIRAKKDGEAVDVPAFFASLRVKNPALFEKAVVPANSSAATDAPSPPAPAGAGSPTPDAMSMGKAEWMAHKQKRGLNF